MDIKDLTVFYEVAKEKHISRSEKFKLCTVWRNNAYETTRKRIRCAFILPKRKGVTLTSNGEILLTYAKQIIHLIDQSVKAVQSNGIEPRGTLKLDVQNLQPL